MNLGAELSSIKGVGPKTAEKLAAAGFLTVGDVINFLPRTYEDFSEITPIRQLSPGKVTVRARVDKVSNRNIRWRMNVTTAVLDDGTGKVQVVWFNQPYRATQFKPDEEYYFSGEFGFSRGRYQITSPSAEAVKDLPVQTGRILPIYPAIKGLKPSLTRSVLDKLRPVVTMLPETLPDEIVSSQKLLPRSEAVSGLHFPEDSTQADAARERLAFEELFELLLASRLNKQENSKLRGFKIPFDQPKIKEFVDKLPFKLTNSQRRAIWDILCDFGGQKSGNSSERTLGLETSASPTAVWRPSPLLVKVVRDSPREQTVDFPISPMNRMLQGDVGSGKTVVAGAAAYQASLAGYQSAIMAPTEILATQHAETLDKLLTPFGVKVALLTGSVKGKVRTELNKAIADGEVDIVVGTHALFQKDVKFKNLGFVVIDEQHRFGVEQRQALLAKSEKSPKHNPEARSSRPSLRGSSLTSGRNLQNASELVPADFFLPHLLSMTATPIPRSLQLTVFGDLDISVLTEMPAGRKKIETKIWQPTSLPKLHEAIREQLKQGRQAYIVTPLIEESETEKVAAETEFKKIGKVFKDYKVALLHGKMPSAEKEKTMREFAEHKIDILVATTVIEVGVDVSNATVMLIENADGFGLSQLHQLRGRVGRGEHQSYCHLLLSENKPPTRRLREIEKSNDGFYLSEVDLQLRGPGEIYGTMQHGQLNLQIANLADTKLVARAAKSADWFIVSKKLSDYPDLQKSVIKYQKITTLN